MNQLTLEFDKGTRSFPCRKCGHFFTALKHFRIMASTLKEMKNVFLVEIVTRSFVKMDTHYFIKYYLKYIRHKLLNSI